MKKEWIRSRFARARYWLGVVFDKAEYRRIALTDDESVSRAVKVIEDGGYHVLLELQHCVYIRRFIPRWSVPE